MSFQVSSSYMPQGEITLTGVGTAWNAPGKLVQLSIAPDGQVWGHNSAGSIYTLSNSAQDWTPIPEYLSQIAAAPGGVAWGVNIAGSIYRWDPGQSQWDWIPGNLAQISVGVDGDVWGINSAHFVYHFDKAAGDWQIPGALSKISVGFDGAVWGLGLNGEVFRLRPGPRVLEQIPGWFSQISVGGDGEVWGVNPAAGSIYRFNAEKRDWELTPGSFQADFSRFRRLGLGRFTALRCFALQHADPAMGASERNSGSRRGCFRCNRVGHVRHYRRQISLKRRR